MLEEKRCFPFFPGGELLDLEELQSRLNFAFLPHNAFESEAHRAEILQRGLEKWKSGELSEEAQALGSQWQDKIGAAYIPAVSIRWLGDSFGHGLFCEETLEEGSYVGEYTGRIRVNNRRYFEPLNNYCYEYPVPDDLGRSHVIDASCGNLTRFINHSDRPNLRPVHVFRDGFYHLIFLALKRIEKGTQLCYHYGKNYWYIREAPLNLPLVN
ncbi:MAG: SET domain-containing protein-lysine N-methyltransferase [Chlamydiota bacterium]